MCRSCPSSWTSSLAYEPQAGSAPPDSVLAAVLLNKTSGPLRQHLSLNARTLTTYQDLGPPSLTTVGLVTSSLRHGFFEPMPSSHGRWRTFQHRFLKGNFEGKGKKRPHLNVHQQVMSNSSRVLKFKRRNFGFQRKGKSKGKPSSTTYFGLLEVWGELRSRRESVPIWAHERT